MSNRGDTALSQSAESVHASICSLVSTQAAFNSAWADYASAFMSPAIQGAITALLPHSDSSQDKDVSTDATSKCGPPTTGDDPVHSCWGGPVAMLVCNVLCLYRTRPSRWETRDPDRSSLMRKSTSLFLASPCC